MKTLIESILSSTGTGIYKAEEAIQKWLKSTENNDNWKIINHILVYIHNEYGVSIWYGAHNNDFPHEYLPFEKDFKNIFCPGPFIDMPKEYWPKNMFGLNLRIDNSEEKELNLPLITLTGSSPSSVHFDYADRSKNKHIKYAAFNFTTKNPESRYTSKNHIQFMFSNCYDLSDIQNIHTTGEPFNFCLENTKAAEEITDIVKKVKKQYKKKYGELTPQLATQQRQELYTLFQNEILPNCKNVKEIILSSDNRKLRKILFNHDEKRVLLL